MCRSTAYCRCFESFFLQQNFSEAWEALSKQNEIRNVNNLHLHHPYMVTHRDKEKRVIVNSKLGVGDLNQFWHQNSGLKKGSRKTYCPSFDPRAFATDAGAPYRSQIQHPSQVREPSTKNDAFIANGSLGRHCSSKSLQSDFQPASRLIVLQIIALQDAGIQKEDRMEMPKLVCGFPGVSTHQLWGPF